MDVSLIMDAYVAARGEEGEQQRPGQRRDGCILRAFSDSHLQQRPLV